MSQVSTLTTQIANHLSLFTLPDPVEVRLLGILIGGGTLLVYITDGRHNYTLQPKAKTLTSFPQFQQFVLDEKGVLISHRAQDAPTSRCRRREWGTALRTAFDRGMGIGAAAGGAA